MAHTPYCIDRSALAINLPPPQGYNGGTILIGGVGTGFLPFELRAGERFTVLGNQAAQIVLVFTGSRSITVPYGVVGVDVTYTMPEDLLSFAIVPVADAAFAWWNARFAQQVHPSFVGG